MAPSVCIALICMALATTANALGTVGLLPLLTLVEEIPLAKVNRKLETRLDFHPEDLMMLLAKAQSKAEPKGVLGLCSVDDLLELANYQLHKCTAPKLKAIDDECKTLRSNVNLYSYCKRQRLNTKGHCQDNMDKVHRRLLRANGFTREMEEKASKFWHRVYSVSRTINNRNRPRHDHYIEAVEKVLTEDKSRANIETTCAALVTILSKDFMIQERLAKYDILEDPDFHYYEKKWSNIFDYCKLVEEIAQRGKS